MDGISVIVCCYNSASRLPLTLEHLAKQKTSEALNWEIIIVNNNSTDNTAEIARQLWQSLAPDKTLRIIHEDKAGLSFAREAGIKAACYEIIIFCDDDNLLAENYIQHGYDLVKKTIKAGYGIWGGKPVAYFDANTVIPNWFEKDKANYVVGKQAAKTGDISERGYVWGAGMIILKSIYLKIVNSKFPSLLKDRTGNTLTSGGDSEISLRTLIAGYKLYYDENLVLNHYISKDKLTKSYNSNLIAGFEAANTLLNKYGIFIHYVSRRNIVYRFYYALVYSVKYALSIVKLRSLTPHDETVLHALFPGKFKDADFHLMRNILNLKTTDSTN